MTMLCALCILKLAVFFKIQDKLRFDFLYFLQFSILQTVLSRLKPLWKSDIYAIDLDKALLPAIIIMVSWSRFLWHLSKLSCVRQESMACQREHSRANYIYEWRRRKGYDLLIKAAIAVSTALCTLNSVFLKTCTFTIFPLVSLVMTTFSANLKLSWIYKKGHLYFRVMLGKMFGHV